MEHYELVLVSQQHTLCLCEHRVSVSSNSHSNNECSHETRYNGTLRVCSSLSTNTICKHSVLVRTNSHSNNVCKSHETGYLEASHA